jgi:hypothetical protein
LPSLEGLTLFLAKAHPQHSFGFSHRHHVRAPLVSGRED